MDNAQVIAIFIAGFVVPFIQESIFGAKISGQMAGWVTVLTALVIATIATWASGGFAGAAAAPAFSLLDPREFIGFWVGIWAPVYAISQIVYSTTTQHPKSPPATGPIQTVADKVQPVIGTA